MISLDQGQGLINCLSFKIHSSAFWPCSVTLLGGTIQCLLESMHEKYPTEVAEIEKSLYIDDVISGGETTEAVHSLKGKAVDIFEQAKFTFHKWHSNKPELESGSQPSEVNQSYAKEHLGVKPGETKLLGLPWNKATDTIATVLPNNMPVTTKREMLPFLASIYDRLIVSPISPVGKLIYRDVCDQRWPCDAELLPQISNRWRKLENALPERWKYHAVSPPMRHPIRTLYPNKIIVSNKLLGLLGSGLGFGSGFILYA